MSIFRHSVTGFGTEEPTHFRERRHSLDENCTGMGTGSGSTQGQGAEHALIEYEEEDSRQEEEEVKMMKFEVGKRKALVFKI